MKKIFHWALLLSLTFTFACGGEGESNNTDGKTPDPQVRPEKPSDGFVPAPDQNGPIQFSHPEQLFGTAKSGDTVTVKYPFKNMKDYAISLDTLYTSCPCIVGEYPTGQIAPGTIDEITVHFYTEGQPIARYEKIISVMVENQEVPIVLQLKGEVTQ